MLAEMKKSESIRLDSEAMLRLRAEKQRLSDLFTHKKITFSDVIRFHCPKPNRTATQEYVSDVADI